MVRKTCVPVHTAFAEARLAALACKLARPSLIPSSMLSRIPPPPPLLSSSVHRSDSPSALSSSLHTPETKFCVDDGVPVQLLEEK